MPVNAREKVEQRVLELERLIADIQREQLTTEGKSEKLQADKETAQALKAALNYWLQES